MAYPSPGGNRIEAKQEYVFFTAEDFHIWKTGGFLQKYFKHGIKWAAEKHDACKTSG